MTTGYGMVGPATRAKINAMLAGSSSASTANTTLSPAQIEQIKALIRAMMDQVQILIAKLMGMQARGN